MLVDLTKKQMTLEGAKNRDAILRTLIVPKPPKFVLRKTKTVSEISVITKIDEEKIKVYLNVLSKDGYIQPDSGTGAPITMGSKIVDSWELTEIGVLFIVDGGYESYYQDSQSLSRIAKRHLFLAVCVAIGAIVASIYYAIEILKFVNEHYCFCRFFR